MIEEREDNMLEPEDFAEHSEDILDLISSEDELENEELEKILQINDNGFVAEDIGDLSDHINEFTNVYNKMSLIRTISH